MRELPPLIRRMQKSLHHGVRLGISANELADLYDNLMELAAHLLPKEDLDDVRELAEEHAAELVSDNPVSVSEPLPPLKIDARILEICNLIEEMAEDTSEKVGDKEQRMYDILGELQDALDCPLPPKWRTREEIGEAMGEMFERVWYNRHMCHHINDGHIDQDGEPQHNGGIGCDAAIAKERKYPGIGDHDDFEYGMINGKLSALRWVAGEEWDFLDT